MSQQQPEEPLWKAMTAHNIEQKMLTNKDTKGQYNSEGISNSETYEKEKPSYLLMKDNIYHPTERDQGQDWQHTVPSSHIQINGQEGAHLIGNIQDKELLSAREVHQLRLAEKQQNLNNQLNLWVILKIGLLNRPNHPSRLDKAPSQSMTSLQGPQQARMQLRQQMAVLQDRQCREEEVIEQELAGQREQEALIEVRGEDQRRETHQFVHLTKISRVSPRTDPSLGLSIKHHKRSHDFVFQLLLPVKFQTSPFT
jgi:hypothetical protein